MNLSGGNFQLLHKIHLLLNVSCKLSGHMQLKHLCLTVLADYLDVLYDSRRTPSWISHFRRSYRSYWIAELRKHRSRCWNFIFFILSRYMCAS